MPGVGVARIAQSRGITDIEVTDVDYRHDAEDANRGQV